MPKEPRNRKTFCLIKTNNTSKKYLVAVYDEKVFPRSLNDYPIEKEVYGNSLESLVSQLESNDFLFRAEPEAYEVEGSEDTEIKLKREDLVITIPADYMEGNEKRYKVTDKELTMFQKYYNRKTRYTR